ncbi:hypothetical protein CENSYa_1963 [Cenarchaeum symbiosum A]|uniref:Uncharacterized protein n=1 Tax=Cenarchaeum symbiosum (strain A) TaxID=414004 RepID=A0RZ03_CENSY|nr:hypothetical protein CENSYa_1963 [Cenarchaeum symbiosum A]
MAYREIYCVDCRRILGRYNIKYYPESKMGEIIKSCHDQHVREGHELVQRRSK